ncbi:amino acid permease [Paenibacillus radicis (ex Gao et al. 2016)]|uniref:Amino acid permease n=1 Tax=Paenibacillus radicis (ex Gao et al. 2016) TaxID=1737354 RepID=A0A917MCC9_9BACL|nr:amino acid permease [Paenibacillus radicis (ex Gao et al. 2016)]GGG88363.1 amino acid permease [Paenibacillus radicis (ex Gao et al. 2016)]
MIFVWLGMLLFVIVCALAMAIAFKAQQSIRASHHRSMTGRAAYIQAQQDKHDLNLFGIAQQLRRRFGGLGSFGLSFNALGVIGASVLFLGPALQKGGPSVVVIGLPIAALFALAVSAALAQLASAVPTAGGVYHWASAIGKRVWGWYAGWFQLAGSLAMTALMNGACAFILDQALAVKFGYSSQWWTMGLLALAVTGTQAAANHWGVAVVAAIQQAGVWLQIGVVLTILTGLAYLFWPGVYSPALLYTFQNASLNGHVGLWPFIAGMLFLQKLFIGMDAAAYAAEETHDPRIRIPWAIFLSTVYSYIIGFVLLLFILLVFPVVLPSEEGGGGMFLNAALQAVGASPVIGYAIAAVLWCSGFGSQAASSRSIFCMARDNALPFAHIWTRLTAGQSPKDAVWLAAGLSIGLLSAAGLLRGTQYPLVLFSFALLCLHVSYAIPIALLIKLKGKHKLLHEAPWRLGDWGMIVYWSAFLWLAATAVLSITAIGYWGLCGAILLFGLTAAADRKYRQRHLAKLQSRLKRPRGEIIRIERKFHLH